jgi:hypothetical protein
MTLNRILVIAAVVCFALAALSAFSDDITMNETGWIALGLAAWAGSALTLGIDLGAGRRRRSVLR